MNVWKCEYGFYFSWCKFGTTKVRKLTEILFQPMPVRLGGYNPRGVAATRPALCWNCRDLFTVSITVTVYPKKYAHGFVVLCFVVVMQSFIMNSHEVFINIHQGCFAGTGAIVRLPQCQWSKPDGYGKISQCITTTKHSKAKTVCIFLGIYCTPHGPQLGCVFKILFKRTTKKTAKLRITGLLWGEPRIHAIHSTIYHNTIKQLRRNY